MEQLISQTKILIKWVLYNQEQMKETFTQLGKKVEGRKLKDSEENKKNK